MAIVNNDCKCIETGECTCHPDKLRYFCTCKCGCEECTTEDVAEGV